MAVVKGFQKVTGTIQNVTFYTVQGSDKVYMRTKGGPSKNRIKKDRSFEKLRRNNTEWKGCTMMTSQIRDSLFILKPMEDYPVCGALNGINKQIQKTDTEGVHGKRGLYLSKNKDLLGGFSVSRKQELESVLRIPINATLDRDAGTAHIALPSIETSMYLYNFQSLPYFRLVTKLTTVSDLEYSEEKGTYELMHEVNLEGDARFISEWIPSIGTIPAMNIDLALPQIGFPLPDCVTLILGFGLEFAKPGADGKPESVKYAGCGKVIRVG